MEHEVTIDTVIFRIRAHHLVDGTCEVALLVQYIVELQHYAQVALHEGMAYLCIPNQFIGVHRRVAVATT